MDYTSGRYSVRFPAGVMSVPFSISINDDNIFEDNENFTLTIYPSLPTGVMVGNPGQATVTIVDNDCKCWYSFSLCIIFLTHNYYSALCCLSRKGVTQTSLHRTSLIV